MHIIRKKGWEIPEREATPEHLALSRRSLVRAGAILGAGGLAGAAGMAKSMAGSAAGMASSAASARPATVGSASDNQSGGVPSWVWAVAAIVVIAGVAYWWFKMRGA